MTCTAVDATAFNTPNPTCVPGVAADGSPYVTVSNLKTGQFSYELIVDSINNANSAKSVSGIQCMACTESTCSSVIETNTLR